MSRMLAPNPGWPQRLRSRRDASNLADQCETDAVAPMVVGPALVGQAGGETLEQSRQISGSTPGPAQAGPRTAPRA